MISIETLDACEASLKAALRREEGLMTHNQLLLRENSDLRQRYKDAVNELAKAERELERLKAVER